ncbi:MAG: hypothetical protein V1737_01645 [Chloroflexota bacterium]
MKGMDIDGQRELEELRVQFKAELVVPAPEIVLIDDFGAPGAHSIPLKKVLSKVSWQSTGDIAGKKGLTATADKINVVVSRDGGLELFCPTERDALFAKLLSSLSEAAQERLTIWKRRGGEYVEKCTDVHWHIHTDTNRRVLQLVYEELGRDAFKQTARPRVTPDFGDLVYHLCLLCPDRSGEIGRPDKKMYQVKRRSPICYELYLGRRRLVTTPGPPHFLPRSRPLPSFPAELLMRWADIHRDMINDWSSSAATMELQELFGSLRRIESEIKGELG